jgi:hypothetical protein
MRIIVLGGRGYFGSLAAKCLREEGLHPLIASRSAKGDLVIDVEDRDSLRVALRPGDVVLDAVGPFQRRTTTLIESAIEIGCDVVDLADSLAYVRQVYALEDRIAAAGIRVFTACSSVSAISAAMVTLSGIERPRRVTGLLVPATGRTAVRGTAQSLFASVGRPIEVFRDGQLTTCLGFSRRRTAALPPPLGRRTCHLVEMADAITLPRCWPSLREVEFYVDTNVLGLNTLFRLAARWPTLRRVIDRASHRVLFLARWFGRNQSGLAYEIEGDGGQARFLALTAERRGQMIPVAPAVLAARSMAAGECRRTGILLPNEGNDARQLLAFLQRYGVHLTEAAG